MDKKILSSIKAWAIVLGILSLFALWTLSVYPIASVEGILALVGLILGLAIFYIGFNIASLSLYTAIGIFWAKFAVLVIDFLLFLTARRINLISVIVVVAQGIIVWYLIDSAKKLEK